MPCRRNTRISNAASPPTIRAYPTNGGAYTVSKENLGTNASLLAAAALTIDYILNVAVGISAGVGALTSALPSLHEHALWLCLAILVLTGGASSARRRQLLRD